MEALYDNGRPIHIARPTESVIRTLTYESWKALSPIQMQQELRKKNVIVTGWPLQEKTLFDEDGLRKVAGAQSRQISINGKSHSLYAFYTLYLSLSIFQTILSSP